MVGLIEELKSRYPGLDPHTIDDIVLGAVSPVGDQGANLAKTAALAAGLPDTVAGVQLNRFCDGVILTSGKDTFFAGGDLNLLMNATPETAPDIALGLDTYKAAAWIAAHRQAAQPWDVKGYKIPGGTPSSPAVAANLPAFPANVRKQLKGAPMPAPIAVLATAVEGAQVDIDTAFAIETRYCTNLICGQVSTNMIKSLFFDLGTINKGGSRPDGFPARTPEKVLVLGAGMIGAGIAYVQARAGMRVVLKDVTLEAAERGKDYSRKLLDKALRKGAITQEKYDEILDRIHPTADPADAAGCDFVVEAVFEDPGLKQKVFGEIEELVNPDALLGSNTSTLPITELARGVTRQPDFIGLHFHGRGHRAGRRGRAPRLGGTGRHAGRVSGGRAGAG